jgi:hypothetical protein
MLGDSRAAARRYDRCHRRDVEGPSAVAARPGGVHDLALDLDRHRGASHRPRQSRQLLGRLALHPQGGGEGADLGGRRRPVDDVLHRRRGLLLAQVFADHQASDRLLDGHGLPPLA